MGSERLWYIQLYLAWCSLCQQDRDIQSAAVGLFVGFLTMQVSSHFM